MKEVIELFQETLDRELKNGNYSVDLTSVSSVSGYIDGFIIFDGLKIKCAFNKKGFICYHNDLINSLNLTDILRPYEEEICKNVFEKSIGFLLDEEIKQAESRLVDLRKQQEALNKTE